MLVVVNPGHSVSYHETVAGKHIPKFYPAGSEADLPSELAERLKKEGVVSEVGRPDNLIESDVDNEDANDESEVA